MSDDRFDRDRDDSVWWAGRWLVALIVFLVALGVLFPLAVEAMRAVLALSD